MFEHHGNTPVISYRVRAKAVRKGAVLIVADPREIDLVDIAHYHLPLRPGTDVALLNGLITLYCRRPA